MDKHYLNALFSPQSVVVFSENPGAISIAPQLLQREHSQRPDLALIHLAPEKVNAALEETTHLKCRAAVVLSAGMADHQAQELAQMAHQAGMALLGPNSFGFQRPIIGLNASLAAPLAAKGSLGLVSQSGALTSSILDWASQNGVGFSTVVSLGRHTVTDLADVLDFLAADAHTQSIVVYMEGIARARRFMSALRAAAISKPVVILKAGRKQGSNAAAQTHSGAIVGSDEVFDAALRRAGAVRVRSFVELFSATKCLASRYRPVGKCLAIVTNGGGPGVLAADWLAELNLTLGILSPEQAVRLQPLISPMANVNNLIDLGEDASPIHYEQALQACNQDSAVDGVLVIHSPKSGGDAHAVARQVAQYNAHMKKPLLSCWMGDASVIEARKALNAANIPSFRTPEAAVGAFGNIASFYQNQRLLQQTPPSLSRLANPDVEGARLLIEGVLAERRYALTEMESKALLSAFHIPVTQTILARSAPEAMMIASQMGYPVALKIDSPDISHKSDVNGVALNLLNALAVHDTYHDMMKHVAVQQPQARINGVSIQKMAPNRRGREVCIGLVTDDPFGPVISFGAGGTMIELIDDRAMELPPLNQFLAKRLIERARVAATFGEWRGANAVKVEALEHILLRVSEMVCALPQLQEMDINPIIVDDQGAVAVDARIVLKADTHIISNPLEATTGDKYAHLAIHPYPAQYKQVWPLRGGDQYTIRPVRPDDAQMLQELVRNLSPESRYFRFVSSMTELPSNMLSRFTLIDYDREMALVAVYPQQTIATESSGSTPSPQRIIGVSRFLTNADGNSCEFALVVADDFGGKGLGSRLMLSIMDVAREKGLSEIRGLVLANNPGMLRLMKSLGFSIEPFAEDPDFRLVWHEL